MATLLERIKAHPHVEEVSDERNLDQGIWAYLKPGYHDGYDALAPTHQVHEDTPSAVLRQLRFVKVCDCDDCKKQPNYAKFLTSV